MTEHLPECLALLNDSTWDGDCICEALRACEQRVRKDEQSHFLTRYLLGRNGGGYRRGLDAAREAVLGAKAIDVAYGRGLDEPAQFIWLNQAISAIDALREDRQTPPPLPPSVGVPERRWT